MVTYLLKIPAVRLRRAGNLRNVRYLNHFIVVRSLTRPPQADYGNCARWSIFKIENLDARARSKFNAVPAQKLWRKAQGGEDKFSFIVFALCPVA
jgi:hypothetical protein